LPDPLGAPPRGKKPQIGNGDLAPAAKDLDNPEVAEALFHANLR
jgi:hypothetical protein